MRPRPGWEVVTNRTKAVESASDSLSFQSCVSAIDDRTTRHAGHPVSHKAETSRGNPRGA